MSMHREHKQAIRSFMQRHYTDARLAELLAHAQMGRLRYTSCCCFIGIVTADHALETRHRSLVMAMREDHFNIAERLLGAEEAEESYKWLGYRFPEGNTDEVRRRILIPMIRAEQRRRDRMRAAADVVLATGEVTELEGARGELVSA